MTFQTFIFYAFSAILIFAAVGVITARNPVHSALLLVLAFFTSAGLWIQLQAEFLAIVLVLVYVGAVMVLFLFVVMMLDINVARLREGFWSYLPLGALVAALLVNARMQRLMPDWFTPRASAALRPEPWRLIACMYRFSVSVANCSRLGSITWLSGFGGVLVSPRAHHAIAR